MKVEVRYGVEMDSRCVSLDGSLSDYGRQLLKQLRADIDAVLSGHTDNTNSSCRVCLDEHDCCGICNNVGPALMAMEQAQ